MKQIKMQDHKIHIIGAGVSGLIAAQVLEEKGFSPIIMEATDRVGGRVKTDIVDGYQLDHGFQVLLTAYPAAQKYLDFKALDLQTFLPGSAIFNSGKQTSIGDPLRELSLLFSTIFSDFGTVSDKIKVLKLNNLLKKKSIEAIFLEEEKTTFQYLVDFGFSEKMISQFFKPFFTGIFLETELDTSSRMFEFIYKMFGEGVAALPKGGIEAIPKQLAAKLKKTTFHFNTKVTSVKNKKIILSDAQEIESDYTIIATDASGLLQNLKNQEIAWKSCDTLYFETEKRIISKPLIGLIANSDTLINNIFYHTSLKTAIQHSKELLSVTIVKKHELSRKDLILKVQQELSENCGITSSTFLKQYTIGKALPKLRNLQYEMSSSESQITEAVFLAGDIQLNGSLNAAMLSGEKAAEGIIDVILKG
jgi:protoporphyrinogen oxidase